MTIENYRKQISNLLYSSNSENIRPIIECNVNLLSEFLNLNDMKSPKHILPALTVGTRRKQSKKNQNQQPKK